MDRVAVGSGEASVREGQRTAGGVVGNSLAKEQASRVLWLYCSRSMNLLNKMEITIIHMHISCTDNVNRYILFFFLSGSPNGCSIRVCWFLQGHSRQTTMWILYLKEITYSGISILVKWQTSHHCFRGRKRFTFRLPQALSVFLINSKLFPLLPSHPDPQLSPLILWKDTFLRHPATLLMVQSARGHITFQLSDNRSCFRSHLDSTKF